MDYYGFAENNNLKMPDKNHANKLIRLIGWMAYYKSWHCLIKESWQYCNWTIN